MSGRERLFILAGNGPYDNRGCEAIVRGTVEILRARFGPSSFVVCSQFTSRAQLERQREAETDPGIRHEAMRLYPNWSGLANKLLWAALVRLPRLRRENTYAHILKPLRDADALLSVGGDNYTLDYPGSLIHFTDLDRVALDRGKPVVIWGASVGPFSADPALERRMAEHLRRLTGIFARESRTRDYLAQIGLNGNVRLVADPAFVLKPVRPDDADDFPDLGRSIGLNLSPLMGRFVFGSDRKAWTAHAALLARRIRRTLDRPVLLVPHVFDERPAEDDLLFLREVAALAADPAVRLLEKPYSAAEIKWIISRCFAFAGARTHSTIAALSSDVPTISFSYSQKSVGINQDVYGHLSYCLGASQMTEETVSETFLGLVRKAPEIRAHLAARNVKMREAAFSAGQALGAVLEGASRS